MMPLSLMPLPLSNGLQPWPRSPRTPQLPGVMSYTRGSTDAASEVLARTTSVTPERSVRGPERKICLLPSALQHDGLTLRAVIHGLLDTIGVQIVLGRPPAHRRRPRPVAPAEPRRRGEYAAPRHGAYPAHAPRRHPP